jgi:hypothetical protein
LVASKNLPNGAAGAYPTGGSVANKKNKKNKKNK